MIDTPRSVMLFGAGFGTRMGDLTRNRPKPLIPIAGRALIDHALDLADDVDPVTMVVNTHYLADQLTAHLRHRDIRISHEDPILDTGGGLKKALPLLGRGPVYTVNTDTLWRGPNPLRLLQDRWNPDEMDALLMCVPLNRALSRVGEGDFDCDSAGRLRRGSRIVYGGVQILKTDTLDDFQEDVFSLNKVWDQLHTRNRLFGLHYPGQWCDVGHPAGIRTAEAMLKAGDV